MPSLRQTLLLLSFLVFLVGCAGSGRVKDPSLPPTFPGHTVAQILGQMAAQTDSLQAYSAKASLAIRTPIQQANLTATLRHRRSDSLYLSLSPGLGIEAARVLVTPDSFYVHDRISRKLTYGSVAHANSFVPVPVTGDDLFRTFLGIIRPDPGIAWKVEASDTHYFLRHPSKAILFVIDPKIWQVVRYEERSQDGSLLDERTFAEHTANSTLHLPRKIYLRRPQDDTSLVISYQNLTLNPSQLSFTLKVDAAVERILVDDVDPSSSL